MARIIHAPRTAASLCFELRWKRVPLGAVIALLAAPAAAQYRLVSTYMDGMQAGTGSGWVAFGSCAVNTAANTIEFSIFPLPADTLEVRLRGPAAVGETGPILAQLPVEEHDCEGSYAYGEELESPLLSGLVYFEAATPAFPEGEIRGQVFPTPAAGCGCDEAPCGNEYPGRGCANSTGSGARITGAHVPSVSLDMYELVALDVPGRQFGLLFTGHGFGAVPFGDGKRCVAGSVYRYPVRECEENMLCEGPGLVARVAATRASMTPQPGEMWNYQFWFRDPQGPCGSGFNFSDMLSVTWIP